ncbi:MAG: hypothetical protein IKE22_08130 [Atopobiaceae bacterium]|nr:hypothetical protein [Atopobiaceae bacterium]
MQTTNVLRALDKILVVLAIACAGNAVAGYVFGAHATLSDVAWGDYREADELDCAFVGSSYAQRAFDPVAFDEQLGTRSVNLATPGQVLADTLDTVRTVVDEKSVDRVVIGIGIMSFDVTLDPFAAVPYLRARYREDPAALAAAYARLAFNPDVITTKSSLNVLFPWTFTSVRSLSGIIDNVHSRMAGEAFGPAAEKVVPNWYYVGKGYGNYDEVTDPNDGKNTISVYGQPVMLEECLGQLRDICELCRDRGVELVVVVTPHPAYDLLVLGQTYPDSMSTIKALVEDAGATYLDFSMVHHEVLQLDLTDYSDYEHINLSGARKLSVALADILARRDAGEDVSGNFYRYDEWDAWVADHAQS